MVSVLCQTYNHGKYIEECLQSLVTQKVDFGYEILVHDDASTDNTAEIIRRFESEYPDLIKPIYQKNNQWALGNKVFSGIQLPRCTGKYIAICEGDDYWTDPFKLQKQVDFMESDDSYSMCFSRCSEILDVDGVQPIFSHLECRDYTGVEILSNWTVPTASVLFRNYDSYLKRQFPTVMHADIILFLLLADKGKIHCMSDVMAAYRRHANGVTFVPKTIKNLTLHLKHYDTLDSFFKGKYHSVLTEKKNYIYLLLSYRTFPAVSSLNYFLKCLRYPFLLLKNLRCIIKLKCK